MVRELLKIKQGDSKRRATSTSVTPDMTGLSVTRQTIGATLVNEASVIVISHKRVKAVGRANLAFNRSLLRGAGFGAVSASPSSLLLLSATGGMPSALFSAAAGEWDDCGGCWSSCVTPAASDVH